MSRPPAPASCFNSQPPEGGCRSRSPSSPPFSRFNSQPPEGGCLWLWRKSLSRRVSTHSRPKAAARAKILAASVMLPFQLTAARRRLLSPRAKHTSMGTFQLTAARRRLQHQRRPPGANGKVSTHSRPKAAAGELKITLDDFNVSTHSRPKAAAA